MDETKRKLKQYLELNEAINAFSIKKIKPSTPLKNFNIMSDLLDVLSKNTSRSHEVFIRIESLYASGIHLYLYSDLIQLQQVISGEIKLIRELILNKDARIIERNMGSYLTYNNNSNKFEVITNSGNFDDSTLLEEMSYLISEIYMDMFFHVMIMLPTDRFGVCPKCNSPFFALTKRPKTYCSFKCSNASAQAMYLKRQKK